MARKRSSRHRSDSRAMVYWNGGIVEFHLSGEDPLAPALVRTWAAQREAAIKSKTSPFRSLLAVAEARACADMMDRRLDQIANKRNVERLEPKYYWPDLLHGERLLVELCERVNHDLSFHAFSMSDNPENPTEIAPISQLTFEAAKRLLETLCQILTERENFFDAQ